MKSIRSSQCITYNPDGSIFGIGIFWSMPYYIRDENFQYGNVDPCKDELLLKLKQGMSNAIMRDPEHSDLAVRRYFYKKSAAIKVIKNHVDKNIYSQCKANYVSVYIKLKDGRVFDFFSDRYGESCLLNNGTKSLAEFCYEEPDIYPLRVGETTVYGRKNELLRRHYSNNSERCRFYIISDDSYGEYNELSCKDGIEEVSYTVTDKKASFMLVTQDIDNEDKDIHTHNETLYINTPIDLFVYGVKEMKRNISDDDDYDNYDMQIITSFLQRKGWAVA